MKRILITGANSYIGTSFENYVKQWPEAYHVDTVDMIDGSWREKSFTGYDTVFHVAGIAHSDSGKISKEREALYYKINTDLTIETAKKAKADGVKQFIFMSSIIVYGDSAPIGKQKIITKDTSPGPTNCYGDSKLQAENGILLAEFVRLIADNGNHGVFWPQNSEYSNTSDIVSMIAWVHGKSLWLTEGFNWFLPAAARITGLINKAFGNLIYEQGMSAYSDHYQLIGLKESIKRIEKEI